MAENELFSNTTAHRDRQIGFHFAARYRYLVTLRQAHHHAQRTPARDNRRFVHRIRGFHIERHQRMAAFMISGQTFFIIGHDHRAAFRAHHHLVFGVFKFLHGDQTLGTARRQ